MLSYTMRKNIRIAIRVDKQMSEFLRTEADKLDISVGQYIRQVVKEKINDKQRKEVW